MKATGSSTPIDPQRRKLIFWGAAGLINLALPFPKNCLAKPAPPNHPAIVELTRQEALEKPLRIFRDFETDPDPEIKTHILRNLNAQPGLVAGLRQKLDIRERLSVDFESLAVRLLFVPEIRAGYASAHREFCSNLIDYTLNRTQLTQLFSLIDTPVDDFPAIPAEGLSAFMVHRLGKKYQATCKFTGSQGCSVKYKLSGAVFSSHLGAVNLEIDCPQEGVYHLKRKNYSIWQNKTRNLFTLYSIPIEELLHFNLGPSTDGRIGRELKEKSMPNVGEVQSLADRWMAVEEAVVGGLVHQMIEDYARRYHLDLPPQEGERDLARKQKLPQYRFRRRGIELVQKLGCRQAIRIYQDNPDDFKTLL